MQAEQPVVGHPTQIHAGLRDDGAAIDGWRGGSLAGGIVRLEGDRRAGHALLVDLYTRVSERCYIH